jgi:uncharacterized protein YjbI with pentapeptide repeats
MQSGGAAGHQLSLAGQRFPYHDFSGLELDGADLGDCDLRGCRFNRASLVLANLSRANLAGADFAGARIAGCRLIGANLRWAVFTDAVPGRLRIYSGDGSFSGRWQATDLTGAALDAARLEGFDLAACLR